jgi:hypothetical protein
MAFIWTSVSAGTKEITTHVNEAKDNVDTLADNLGVSQYSWSEMPVVQDEEVGQSQIQELQDATDYIDTVNICSAENAGYDTAIDAGDDASVDSTADSAANSSADTTIDTTKHNTVLSSQDTGIDGTKNNTILSDQNTTVDNNQHGTYHGTRYISDNSANDIGYNSTYDNSVLGGPGA